MTSFISKMRGFTLIELVLVLFLVSFLAVVVEIPSLSSNHGLQAASLKVRMDIRRAQQFAMTGNLNYGVNFSSNGTYSIYQGSVGNVATDPLTNGSYQEDLPARFRNVSIQAPFQVEFDPVGRPVIGGGGSLTLISGGVSQVVQVSSNTGAVNLP
ncbi:MAG: prepilin-type N-terminal cleavage/methylation domain-containing protein [Deltaproteobacteria bacterium]|nr:prepilin-type N-terminal cleavage/methylation domain-containing protein [Deltaproteobacteria bacterium]